ncbi:MAG: IPT/TIG domain-containing protein [Actinobacteria bacterium]|nr:IPT/TIG domain-containing protein [Actinomycetota bacterium]MBU1942583.1 IPT/TIG domain-containing protein [Actinomycetota bacterium]MBU2688741.1 IPT/TIG domain-containing protein [Actinomycetota bacterium]
MRRKHAISFVLVVGLVAGLALFSVHATRRPDSVSSATVPAPAISGINPPSGPVGSPVTLTGTNFNETQATNTVTFNGKAATSYTTWAPTQVICAVPSGATSGPVLVHAAGGDSNAVDFTVTVPPEPPPEPTSEPTPTWYLAEGTTDWGFQTRISIQNPNEEPVIARVTYMTGDGPVGRPDITLPPLSQTTLFPADDLGARDFSTRVTCLEGETIAVDRTMTWTGGGASSPESHSSVGVTSPDDTWYLAEGSSDWGFECWLLVQNPNGSEAHLTLTYMIEGAGPATFDKVVPPNSRATFNMAQDIGEADASIRVVSDVPVIPERAMYRNNRREGHDSIGTTTPATDYYLAEGTTDWGFTTYVLVQNPDSEPAEVTVTYMTADFGPQPQPPVTMPANSRMTINVNNVLPGHDLSTQVHGSRPIIAERAMYWDNGTGEACHDSVGMPSPHTTFYLPDGQTSDGWETWTLVQNPNTVSVAIDLYYLPENGGASLTLSDTLQPNSRKSYSMAEKLPVGRASVMVTSRTAGRKIMCERAMYSNSRGSGTDTIGGFAD